MLRVVTLATLFPDATRPNFGVFVERQTLGLAAHPDVDLRLVAPIGLPPWPLARHPRYRARGGVPEHEIWKGLETRRPRFVTLPGTGGRWHGAALVRALVPMLDALRDGFAFDVIDAEFFFPDGPAAVALGRRYGVPVSIKARGADIHHWGHGLTAGQVIAAGQAADGMLAVSEAMKRDMVALGLPEARIRVHRTGVDLDRFAPLDRTVAKAALGVAGPLVVSIGALIERKGHAIVIEAMRAVPDATLWIAGEGPERGRLEALIARLGLAARVRLLGAVPHDDLPRLIAAADVSALASSSEGLANAWVESLACGTPVVITDAGGARELVRDEHAGRVVARGAPAFAAAIRDLLAHPPSPLAVRQAALPFTWEANTAALYAHLSGLVAQRRV
ncbi:glycosyltransferase [Hephaestia sp. GCM10023244]|uniref:glycosyltransferase n=1 Tax=unclassified Hephaestia TaxID=2631281 RepID=UPI00207797FF|nr:glycosyltransferase [Hephaestia sp. MAHUQ-44]MCM8730462.1 glycosyltransferase [Hephaestia sp. MAHUQ-44]